MEISEITLMFFCICLGCNAFQLNQLETPILVDQEELYVNQEKEKVKSIAHENGANWISIIYLFFTSFHYLSIFWEWWMAVCLKFQAFAESRLA